MLMTLKIAAFFKEQSSCIKVTCSFFPVKDRYHEKQKFAVE